MKRIIGSGLAAALLTAAAPALALNLCVEGAYPPFSETADDGSIVGFDVDIGQALAPRLARPARWPRSTGTGSFRRF